MASILEEDAAAALTAPTGGGLSFDTAVFRQYLESLLPPGTSPTPVRSVESSIPLCVSEIS